MNLEEYKEKAITRLNKTIENSSKEKMNYACMGLIEETGEVIAEFRKPLFKGNFHEKPLDMQEIKSELGDLLWYIALICKNVNINIGQLQKEVAESNLSKREALIQLSIKIGTQSGKIVEEYQNFNKEETQKENLKLEIDKQCENIFELSKLVNIEFDEILKENLNKINSRYNEKGEKRDNEQEK